MESEEVPQVRSIDRVDLSRGGSIWKEKREKEGGDTLLHSATNPLPTDLFLK